MQTQDTAEIGPILEVWLAPNLSALVSDQKGYEATNSLGINSCSTCKKVSKNLKSKHLY